MTASPRTPEWQQVARDLSNIGKGTAQEIAEYLGRDEASVRDAIYGRGSP